MNGEAFYWLAANMTVWVTPAVMSLAGLLIGLLHFMAIALEDR